MIVFYDLKLRLLRALVFPIAVYGCESWSMNKADQKRVDAFEMWCYRRILRISWTEMRSNVWILDQIGTSLMLRETIRRQKLRFFGHVVRRDGLDKLVIRPTGKVNGRRRRGLRTSKQQQD